MDRAAIDTNVWISAAEQLDADALALLALGKKGLVEIVVSQHTLAELRAGASRFGDRALNLAAFAFALPCWPTGTIADLAGPIAGLAGTIADIRNTDAFRDGLADIAKKGTDLRDRGALIDAIRAGVRWFVSNDNGIVGSGPRARIRDAFAIETVRPSELLSAFPSVNR